MPVDDESSEWAFCEFPKIDTAIIIIIIIINRFVQRHKVAKILDYRFLSKSIGTTDVNHSGYGWVSLEALQ